MAINRRRMVPASHLWEALVTKPAPGCNDRSKNGDATTR